MYYEFKITLFALLWVLHLLVLTLVPLVAILRWIACATSYAWLASPLSFSSSAGSGYLPRLSLVLALLSGGFSSYSSIETLLEGLDTRSGLEQSLSSLIDGHSVPATLWLSAPRRLPRHSWDPHLLIPLLPALAGELHLVDLVIARR